MSPKTKHMISNQLDHSSIYKKLNIQNSSGMKQFYFVIVAIFIIGSKGIGQNINVNPGAGSYADLGSAFTAINAGTHTGAITVDVVGNTTEPSSAILNASGVGAANYTSIVIAPSGGAPRTISGSIAGHLIDLNGADFVTIDGLNTGSNSLTIENTLPAATPTAIRFIGDATGNTVQNCTIKGAGTGATLGTVFFSTGTASGNDGNNINNCNINSSGANFATNAVYSLGTSAAIANSGNTLNANNISDFFNAGAISIGVNIANTGNSFWTITNNRLFQSAPRTYTTAAIHNCILVATGDGNTITGNTIGYATSAATGVYTMTSTVATRLIAINLAVGTTTATSVQNNLVTAISLSTSSGAATTNGILCGINITAGNVNVGNVASNTIGASSGTGALIAIPTTSQGAIVGINSSSTGTILIENNIIGSFSSGGTTAAVAGGVFGINVSGAAASMTITGNTIGNATANNMRSGTLGLTTGSSIGSGINASTTPVSLSITNNTVQNFSSYGTGTAGYVRGINGSTTISTTASYTVSQNTIVNLTSQSALVGYASGLTSAIGIQFSGGLNGICSQNTISNISNINATATTNTVVTGISSISGLNNSVFRNSICSISNAGIGTTATAPPIVVGILVRSGNTSVNVYNNMISIGDAQSTNTCFLGIMLNHGSTPDPIDNIYYNTVSISGTVTAGALLTSCLNRGDLSVTSRNQTVNIKNNIFNNTRTGGTGAHYAISNNPNATSSATGWAANASNYNVLNAAAATIGYWTSAQTYAGWQAASASDANSLTAIPVVFASVCDLHLNMGVTPTTLESNGTTITGYTTDFDNNTRPGPTGSVNGGAFAPDLGADEFDGVFLDVSGPSISYTPLSFTCSSGNRTLTATITDVSNVPTSGLGLPVLYWKINAGAYMAVTSMSIGASQYQFIFGAGAVFGDVVSYYIAAQDGSVTPNVGVFPSTGAGGFTANPPAAATPPTAPSTYNITSVLSPGTYTVGAAGTYLTLTAAINDYNSKCLGGPVVFELLDPAYSEVGAMTISKHPDANALNTLTIRPAALVNATVSATVASNAILRILGNYVTIDGSNNGSSSRNLTLSNLSATSPTVVGIGSTGTSPITNVTLKNCIVINGATTATAIVTSDGAVGGTPGYFNNISITNNDIRQAFIGSYSIAVPQAGNGSGLNVSDNLLNTIGAASIRRVGIYVQGVDGAIVSGNSIGNFENVNGENDMGIWFATSTINSVITNNSVVNLGYTSTSTFAPTGINITPNIANANLTVSGNTISGLSSGGGAVGVSTNGIFVGLATSNVTVSKNNISNIKNTAAAGWGANGIILSSTSTTANINVNNNFVFDVAAVGFADFTADDNGYGMAITSGAGYNIVHNTVHLNTDQSLVTGLPAALLVAAGITAVGAINLSNNIFTNSQTFGTERYAIYSVAANTVFSNINYNDYFSAGPNVGFIGSNRVDLAAIQAGFGRNVNSVSVSPTFVSATDLHLDASNAINQAYLNARAFPSSVTDDIDFEPRDGSYPDIGADEIATSCTTVVTNSSDSGPGTLRYILGCIADGGTITYDQPTTVASSIISQLVVNKNVTILGLSSAMKPEITLDFNLIPSGINPGILVLSGKVLTLKDVDIKDINNGAARPIIQTEGTVNVTGSSNVLKI